MGEAISDVSGILMILEQRENALKKWAEAELSKNFLEKAQTLRRNDSFSANKT